MAYMTGGQILMKTLYSEGVRVIFGLPGVQLYHAMDALYDEAGIQFITTRHEQAAAYMADGYARASGDTGTTLVVPGPGLLNASAAIGTAYASSSPVLIISGQIPKDLIGLNRGVLHEVDDQIEAIRQVTKWAQRILDPANIPEIVHEAFHKLRTGRPRPVELEIPPETLAETANVVIPSTWEYFRPAANLERIFEGARILTSASNLLIWAGGGVISSGASDILTKVAEHLQSPVICTPEGKGAISDRHYLAAGVAIGHGSDQLSQHDVILAIGTRLATTSLRDTQQVVQIDVDGEEIGRNYPNTLGLLGDARRTLEAMLPMLEANTSQRPSRQTEMEMLRSERDKIIREIQPQNSFTTAIRSAIPENGILVADMTQIGYHSRVGYPVYEPGTYMTSSYFGNLGYAFPTALGAKVAKPFRSVVAVCGDGGFLFNSQELATAVQHGINIVVIVFNDNAYGNVLRDQIERFNGRSIGAKLHNPDFVKLAEAYGASGVRVKEASQLESALRKALSDNMPTLIEVPVEMMPPPFR